MTTLRRWAAWSVVGIGLFLGACASSPEPFDYQPENELKSGPGLFSGEDGVFTLYGKPEGDRKEASGDQSGTGAEEPAQPSAP